MGDERQADRLDAQRSLCNCQSLTAASPVGAEVWPLATSESVDLGTPISAAISASVIPIGSARRSAMRERQVTFSMPASIRDTVSEMQRHPVTEFRHSSFMHKGAKDWPGANSHLGERLVYWRGVRDISRQELAKLARVAVTTLSDIENQRQHSSTRIAQLAEALQINPHYLATGDGYPMNMVQQVPPRHDWPEEFPPLNMLQPLDANERALAGLKLKEAIEEIKARRVKRQRRQE